VQPTTEFRSAGQTIPAELFSPSPASRAGVIVIAYGTDGMTNNLTGPWATTIRGYAHELALLGFVALIPDYFAVTRTTPGPQAAASILTQRDTWQRTLSDALAHGASLADVDPARVGLLGFSLGGHLCLRLRARARVLVELFAPAFPELGGLGVASKLELHAQIHHGDADELVPVASNAAKIQRELEANGAASTLYTYPGAGHGFVGADADNTHARAESQARTLACFKAHL
jgi:dienelactone hydrolase